MHQPKKNVVCSYLYVGASKNAVYSIRKMDDISPCQEVCKNIEAAFSMFCFVEEASIKFDHLELEFCKDFRIDSKWIPKQLNISAFFFCQFHSVGTGWSGMVAHTKTIRFKSRWYVFFRVLILVFSSLTKVFNISIL